MSIEENLLRIKSTIPANVSLIAVSKTHPADVVMEAYNAGQRVFGENKVQELVGKASEMPDDIEWHMIGHLQSNKVKHIAPFVSLIHGVDSFKLLKVIDKEAAKNNRIIPCLLQVHIASEETKFGFSPEELKLALQTGEHHQYKNVDIRGLMGMATFTEDESVIRSEFKMLKLLFNELKDSYFKDAVSFREVSMGMSDDYQIAVEEGTTMVRVGSAIFGLRHYT